MNALARISRGRTASQCPPVPPLSTGLRAWSVMVTQPSQQIARTEASRLREDVVPFVAFCGVSAGHRLGKALDGDGAMTHGKGVAPSIHARW
ncbi:hypothetical protein GCM10023096_12810 [Nonomuraea ferruginea]